MSHLERKAVINQMTQDAITWSREAADRMNGPAFVYLTDVFTDDDIAVLQRAAAIMGGFSAMLTTLMDGERTDEVLAHKVAWEALTQIIAIHAAKSGEGWREDAS